MLRSKKLFIILLIGSFLSTKAQDLPKSYAGLASYIQSNPIDSGAVERIDAHLRVLNDAHRDSLKTTVFPALNQVYLAKGTEEKAFLKSVLAVSSYVLLRDVELTLDFTNEEIQLRESKGISFGLLMAYSRKMFLQTDMSKHEDALETALMLANQLDNNKGFSVYQKANLYRQLCVFFHKINETEYGETYCNKGLDFLEANNTHLNEGALYETLALLKDAQDDVSEEEVINIRKKAEAGAIAGNDSFSLRIIYRNLAISYMELNEPDSVAKYFALTQLFYQRFPYLTGWFMDQVKYAEYLINQRNQFEAKGILDSLETLLPRFEQDISAIRNYHRLRTIYWASNGKLDEFISALNQYDSTKAFSFSEEKLAVREEMLAKYESEKREAENVRLLNEARIQNLIILALVLLLAGLLLIGLLYRNNRSARLKMEIEKNRYRARELTFMEEERDREKSRNQVLQADLEQQMQHLADQQLVISNLSQLVEELREDSPSPLVKKKTAQMKTQLRKGIDAQYYREIYEKMKMLYPELLNYLEKSLGDKEYELISTAMYFMNYETKFIASVFNKSEKAVRNMRYRVRKKLGIPEEADFRIFLIEKNDSLVK